MSPSLISRTEQQGEDRLLSADPVLSSILFTVSLLALVFLLSLGFAIFF